MMMMMMKMMMMMMMMKMMMMMIMMMKHSRKNTRCLWVGRRASALAPLSKVPL